jgi:carbamoyltransferase
MTVRIIGLSLSHDSSACLLQDGIIRSALALERTTRIKRGTVPLHAYAAAMADLTDDILADAGLVQSDIDYWIATSTESRDDDDEARLAGALGLLTPPERRLQLPHPGHHLAHASSAFYSSGFEEAAALVIDAYGSRVGSGRERETAFYFRAGASPERIWQALRDSDRIAGRRRDGSFWLPASLCGIGELYRVITLTLGFCEAGTPYDDAGKTMGLAGYGKRLSAQNLFISVTAEGGLSFERAAGSLVELGLAVLDDGQLRLVPRSPGTPFQQFHYDLAAQIQDEFEEACLHLARDVLARTGSRSLVLAGGCFLNSLLNARIARETDIDRIFVFPAATDDGNSVGAALYAHHNLTGSPGRAGAALRHVYLGPSRLAGLDVHALADRWHLAARRHAGIAETAAAAAAAIGRGEIVGWFQGRAEFGPRSLGMRSILCHPGITGMKDRLNERVKFRESFRPFAGSVLAEQANKWFDMATPESPFMLFVCPVLTGQREMIKEIVHIDGTCRVQTVDEETCGTFRALIEAFERETGLPLVLNTSFNLRGMPIVERPEEAMDCLYGSRLDRMFIGDFEIEPPDFRTLCPQSTRAGTAILASGVAAGPHAAVTPGRVNITAAELRILGSADGTRPISELADGIGDDLDSTIDMVLELRRHGMVRWAGVPQATGPVFPPAQYSPDRLPE